MSNANQTQVGGTHYRTEYQHWDLASDLELGYFEGQITKYVTRWRSKNGIQDLEKAAHFIAKLREGLRNNKLHPRVYDALNTSLTLYRYNRANRLWMVEEDIVRIIVTWGTESDLDEATRLIKAMMLKHADRRPDALAHERDPQSSAVAAKSLPPNHGTHSGGPDTDNSDEFAKRYPTSEHDVSQWYVAQCERHGFAAVPWLARRPQDRKAWRVAWAGRNITGHTDPHGKPCADEQEKRASTEDGAPGKAYVNQ